MSVDSIQTRIDHGVRLPSTDLSSVYLGRATSLERDGTAYIPVAHGHVRQFAEACASACGY